MIPGWVDAIEEEVAACLGGGEWLSPSQLAARLGVSEACALRYICLLASRGRVTIEQVSLSPALRPSTAGRRGAEDGIPAGSAVG